jgi:tRNA(Ile)-lysidine synthase
VSGSTIQLQSSVADFIRSENLIRGGELVLAAVSGGQDSMAMLSVLNSLSGDEGFTLAAGHFDHKLRAGSAKDMRLVEHFAKSLSLPFYAGEANVLSISEKSGDTIEEAARKARYRFLHKTAEKIGAARIATGHTRDDQVETILMRIIRGTGLRGLTGIHTRRGKLIRPFIHVSRNDTEEYCRARLIRFALDPSNKDRRFTRNRIRLELLPLLKSSFHPGIEINLLNLSRNAQVLVDSMRKNIGRFLEGGFKKLSEHQWELTAGNLKHLDDTSLFILFSDIFAEQLECDMDFSQIHYENLMNLLREEGKSGKELSLPGIRVRREFDSLLFTRTVSGKEPEDKDEVKLSGLQLFSRGIRVPGKTSAPGVSITAEIIHIRSGAPLQLASTPTTAYFSLDSATPPLKIRTPVPGDRIRPFGMKGSKKLSDLFIEKRIPIHQRAKSLVIADAREIMWVVGAATSESFRITNDTKNILKLTVCRE